MFSTSGTAGEEPSEVPVRVMALRTEELQTRRITRRRFGLYYQQAGPQMEGPVDLSVEELMILRAAFILLLCSAIPASATATFAYMLTASISGADQFGQINLNTAAFTSVGNTDLNGNPSDPVALAGLGEVGNTLSGVDEDNLYSIEYD